METVIDDTTHTRLPSVSAITLRFVYNGVGVGLLTNEVRVNLTNSTITDPTLLLLCTDPVAHKAFLKYYLLTRLQKYLSSVPPYALTSLSSNDFPLYASFFINSAFYFYSCPVVADGFLHITAAQNTNETLSKLQLGFRTYLNTRGNYSRVRSLRGYPLNAFFVNKSSKLLANKFNSLNSIRSPSFLVERERIRHLRDTLAFHKSPKITQLFNVADSVGPASISNQRPPRLLTTRLYLSLLQAMSRSCLHREGLYFAACSALSLYSSIFYAKCHRRAPRTLYPYLRT